MRPLICPKTPIFHDFSRFLKPEVAFGRKSQFTTRNYEKTTPKPQNGVGRSDGREPHFVVLGQLFDDLGIVFDEFGLFFRLFGRDLLEIGNECLILFFGAGP